MWCPPSGVSTDPWRFQQMKLTQLTVLKFSFRTGNSIAIRFDLHHCRMLEKKKQSTPGSENVFRRVSSVRPLLCQPVVAFTCVRPATVATVLRYVCLEPRASKFVPLTHDKGQAYLIV